MEAAWKLKVLAQMLWSFAGEGFRTWRADVWRKSPDDYWCCPGTFRHECGCGGLTVRQWIELQHDE